MLSYRALCDNLTIKEVLFMILRSGSYDYCDCFGHVLTKIQIGYNHPVRSGFHRFSWLRQDCLYWVKWVDLCKRQIFIAPSLPRRGIGVVVTFGEYYDVFCRGV